MTHLISSGLAATFAFQAPSAAFLSNTFNQPNRPNRPDPTNHFGTSQLRSLSSIRDVRQHRLSSMVHMSHGERSNESMRSSVVIVSSARTPMGGLLGSLKGVDATELGAVAIRGALEKSGDESLSEAVDEVYMGNVISAGLGQAPARRAALKAGLSESVPCTMINKVCGSGMKAVIEADKALRLGDGKVKVIVAGGMESMSNAPHIQSQSREGKKFGGFEVKDSMSHDGLVDFLSDESMGVLAQDVADQEGFTKEEMDAYAIESLLRANRAIDSGKFDAEIVPVTVKSRRGEQLVTIDEQPGQANIDKIRSLRPAFKTDGTISAATSSSISDGASALVMMHEEEALSRGIRPQARVLAHASHAQKPAEFTLAPVAAIEKVLNQLDWRVEDVDLFEVNEAFAMVAMLPMKTLGIPHEKINVNGGACALGHPLGSSGSRIIVTLLHALEQTGQSRGVAAICIGGGEALAVAVERYSDDLGGGEPPRNDVGLLGLSLEESSDTEQSNFNQMERQVIHGMRLHAMPIRKSV